jgi:hypothetical protein
VGEEVSARCLTGHMALQETVYEPHIIHLMQGPLKAPSLVQAAVGYPGVEVEAGSLAAGEAPVVRDH